MNSFVSAEPDSGFDSDSGRSGEDLGASIAADENPYVGPVPFDSHHTLYGRPREIDEVLQLLLSKRVMLLISPSGAGKTSLIQAGLMPRVRAMQRGGGDARREGVVEPGSRREGLVTLPVARVGLPDETKSANAYVMSVLQSLEAEYGEKERRDPEVLAAHTLQSYFAERYCTYGPKAGRRRCMLVLDQFEELFTLNPTDRDKKHAFFKQLGKLLSIAGDGMAVEEPSAEDPMAPIVWLLLAMREDFIAELEPYCHLVPTGLTFSYRLLALEREPAIDAIVGPSKGLFERAAAERLVDELRVIRRTSAADPTPSEPTMGPFVEPMLLQLSCRRLWERIVIRKQRPITARYVRPGKGKSEVDKALSEYFAGAVKDVCKSSETNERALRDWIEHSFVTKGQMRARVLKNEEVPREFIDAVEGLVRHHIIRTEFASDRSWLELSHDRLVVPVLRNNEEWRSAHLSLLQKQADLWKKSGEKQDFLFSGEQLVESIEFADKHTEELSQTDWDFLEKSKEERARVERERDQIKQERRLFFRMKVLAVLAVLCGVLAAFMAWLSQRSERDALSARYALQVSISDGVQKSAQLRQMEYHEQELKIITAVLNSHETADPRIFRSLLEVVHDSERPEMGAIKPAVDMGLMQVLGTQPPIQKMLGSHGENVVAVAFSPDGQFVLSGSWDKTIKSWPLSGANAESRVYGDHDEAVYSVVVHPGRRLVASASRGGEIKLWRIEDGALRQVATLSTSAPFGIAGRIRCMAFNASGTRLATADYDGKATLWSIPEPFARPVQIAEYGGSFHRWVVGAVAFIDVPGQPERLVTADWLGKIGIWRVDGRTPPTRPERALTLKQNSSDSRFDLRDAITSLALSPNGRWLMAGVANGTVSAWDLGDSRQRTGERLADKEAYDGMVTSLAMSNDGGTLISTGDDFMMIWTLNANARTLSDLRNSLKTRTLHGWGEKLYSVAFQPGSTQFVVVGGTRNVRIVDLNRPSALSTRLSVEGAYSQLERTSLVASDDMMRLAALSDDGRSLVLWQREAGQLVHQQILPLSRGPARRVAVSADGARVAVLYCDGGLTLHDLSTGATSQPVLLPLELNDSQPCYTPSALAFDPSGKKLAAAMNGSLVLYQPGDDGSARLLASGTRQIEAVAFSSDGKMVAEAGVPENAQIWFLDGSSPERKESDRTIESHVTAMTFSPDNKTLLIAGQDGRITEWNMPGFTWNAVNAFHRHAITALSYRMRQGSPFLLSSDQDGQIVVCQSGIAVQNCGVMSRVGAPVRVLLGGPELTHVIVDAGELYWFNLDRQNMVNLAQEQVKTIH
jgi:WD40 repeat protein